MAITSNSGNIGAQVATCESFISKKLFKFRLEGQLFDVWGTRYFAPKIGAKYRPIVQLVPARCKGKYCKNRASLKVGWEKVL